MKNTRKRMTNDLTKFTKTCNEVYASRPYITRSQRRKLKAYRPVLKKMANDWVLGKIAENRLQVLDKLLHYTESGNETSLNESLKLHKVGDVLIDQVYEKLRSLNGKKGGSGNGL